MDATLDGVLTQGDYTYEGSFTDNKRGSTGIETFTINGKRIKRLASFFDDGQNLYKVLEKQDWEINYIFKP